MSKALMEDFFSPAAFTSLSISSTKTTSEPKMFAFSNKRVKKNLKTS